QCGMSPTGLSSHSESVEKSGWMSKWTNYIKGYRQRWFVLDKRAMNLRKRLRGAKKSLGCVWRPSNRSEKLSHIQFEESQSEVGEACRGGSINLHEARVLSDKVTSNIVIAHSTQTFHLKAQNDLDREAWLKALEYARHRANREADSDNDEDETHGASRGAITVEGAKRALDAKMNQLHTSQTMLAKLGKEFEHVMTNGEAIDRKVIGERIHMFIVASATVVQAADEIASLSEKEIKKLEKALSSENSQRIQLQEQLETLAKQHSSLERAAAREGGSGGGGGAILHDGVVRRGWRSIVASYSYTSDEEEFHDAEEDIYDERKGTSSIHSGEDQELFSAEIVVPERGTVMVSPRIEMVSGRSRRVSIPDRPDHPLNLWSIMKNCIGKELSKIPMPVNFSEPLSVLQRITEDLEYAHMLLNEAARKSDALEQMCWVAAYAVSSYSTTGNRTTKPFNPLLGETYECDRMEDLGWRSISEQVSHHPPAAAHHAEGRGWNMFQDFTMTSRFRGKYLSVIPIGHTHVTFSASGNHYTYKKITTTVHNIIVGKLWIDNHGDMEITNHTTGDKCTLKFAQYSYFGRDIPRKVSGFVKDSSGNVKYVMQGTWDDHMDMLKVMKATGKGDKTKVETESPIRLWTVNGPYDGNDRMHHFTRLAIELNEEETGVAPTDSRLRPDQRLMENGIWDEANEKKQELEEKQRAKRKRREAEVEEAIQRGEHIEEIEPIWFEKTQDEKTGSLIHVFKGEYWKAKESNDWSKSPNIF
ncbi:hypothetical protein PENTCL1PPCAC_11531, partial [Pristionchus entomophagus]